jgi:hypothetical protein
MHKIENRNMRDPPRFIRNQVSRAPLCERENREERGSPLEPGPLRASWQELCRWVLLKKALQ